MILLTIFTLLIIRYLCNNIVLFKIPKASLISYKIESCIITLFESLYFLTFTVLEAKNNYIYR